MHHHSEAVVVGEARPRQGWRHHDQAMDAAVSENGAGALRCQLLGGCDRLLLVLLLHHRQRRHRWSLRPTTCAQTSHRSDAEGGHRRYRRRLGAHARRTRLGRRRWHSEAPLRGVRGVGVTAADREVGHPGLEDGTRRQPGDSARARIGSEAGLPDAWPALAGASPTARGRIHDGPLCLHARRPHLHHESSRQGYGRPIQQQHACFRPRCKRRSRQPRQASC
mmetsp:Transcript_118970/g.344100  ORF Transcript_118970/g.344100 Transcript_118970/m.344100 type:complete len:222 (+) Transcript_118970:871-1536(+)